MVETEKKKTKVEYYFDGQTASGRSSSDSSFERGAVQIKNNVVVLQSDAKYTRMPSDNNPVFKVAAQEQGQPEAKEHQSLDTKDPKLEFTTLSKVATGKHHVQDETSSQTSVSVKQPQPANIKESKAWRLLGVFILICAIIGGSSIGTIANFIPAETSFAKNSWRSGIIVTIFIIPAICEYFANRHSVSYRSLINVRQYSFLLLTLLCQVLWTAGLIYASLNTIQSQAYVFNNVHGLYIVLISLFMGVIPSRKEWIGLLLAIMGCVCIILDPEAMRVTNGEEGGIAQSFWPGVIDLASAFFGALYFIMSAHNVKNLPVCLLILIMNMHTWLINGLVAKYQNSEISLLSFDAETGCLGFLNLADNALLPLLCYAVFASFFGSAGLGLDKLPGVMTAIGTMFAVAGIAFIDSGSRDRQAIQNEGQNQQTPLPLNKSQDGELPLDLSNLVLNRSSLMELSGLNISHYSGR